MIWIPIIVLELMVIVVCIYHQPSRGYDPRPYASIEIKGKSVPVRTIAVPRDEFGKWS